MGGIAVVGDRESFQERFRNALGDYWRHVYWPVAKSLLIIVPILLVVGFVLIDILDL